MPPTTRLYIVKTDRRYGWGARIWITDDGCFTTISDWGNYGYWFGSPGCEFRKFLTECDDDYIMRKFNAGERVPDEAATSDAIKEEILRLRRAKELTAERARDEWYHWEESNFDSEGAFAFWLNGTELENAHEYWRTTVPGAVQGFVKNVWPLFVDQLKAELASEAAATTTAAE